MSLVREKTVEMDDLNSTGFDSDLKVEGLEHILSSAELRKIVGRGRLELDG